MLPLVHWIRLHPPSGAAAVPRAVLGTGNFVAVAAAKVDSGTLVLVIAVVIVTVAAVTLIARRRRATAGAVAPRRDSALASPVASAGTIPFGGWGGESDPSARLAQLQTLLSVMPVGIAIAQDPEARNVRVNPYYADLLGVPPGANASLVGEDVPHGYHLERHGRTLATDELPMRRAAREGLEMRDLEMDLVRADGRVVNLLATVVPLRDEQGRLRGSVGAFFDITQRKRIEHESTAAKEAAEDASRSKDHFLATLSHELRMPLTPVLAAVTAMLNERNLPPELTTTLEMVRRNVELQTKLIDDLLDITRISRGKMRMKFVSADAHALIAQTIEICRPDIEEAVLELGVELTAEEHWVRADPSRLQQALWNLIKNAVKYTPAGGRITVRTVNAPAPATGPMMTTGAPARSRLFIEVADTGVGIEPEMLVQIFDPFVQAEPGALGFHGLGLGLAISRSLVAAHGGRLSANSDGKGKGAAFTIDLETVEPMPIDATAYAREPVSTTHPVPEPAMASGGAARRVEILLVEDHDDTLRTLSRILRKRGHVVRTAKTIAEAEMTARQAPFDLLIADVGLPDGSGRDLLHRLRPLVPNLRAIAISGFGMEEDVQSSLEAGFADHLAKPVDIARVEEAIDRLSS